MLCPKDVGESSKTIREEDPRTVTETPEVNSSSRDEIDSVQAESTTSHDRGFETSLGEMSITMAELRPTLLSILNPEENHRGIRNLKTLKYDLIISMLI
jgi:hypothetical protein